MSTPVSWGYGPTNQVISWGYGKSIAEIIEPIIEQIKIIEKKIRSIVISGTIRKSPIRIDITIR